MSKQVDGPTASVIAETANSLRLDDKIRLLDKETGSELGFYHGHTNKRFKARRGWGKLPRSSLSKRIWRKSYGLLQVSGRGPNGLTEVKVYQQSSS